MRAEQQQQARSEIRPSIVLAAILLSCLTTKAATAHPAGAACRQIVLMGRVTHASYVELPDVPGAINLDVLWTLDVSVKRVLRGVEHRTAIKVVQKGDARPRQDRDLEFHLFPVGDGSYSVSPSETGCTSRRTK
jgi:hypothetical protein